MGFWSKILGKKEERVLTEAELLVEAQKFLQEIEQLIFLDLKRTTKLINKRSYEFDPLFEIGGSLHKRFAEVVLKTKHLTGLKQGASMRELNYEDLPSVTVISNGKTETLGQVVDISKDAKEEVIRLTFWKEASHRIPNRFPMALNTIEILCEFIFDPDVVYIWVDRPWEIFIRKSFLLSEIPASDRDVKIGRRDETTRALLRYVDENPEEKMKDYGYFMFKFYGRSSSAEISER